MLIPLLFTTTLLSPGGTHAGLHPANTNLYVEAPDVDAVTAAYEQAPVIQFLHDERVILFAAKVSGEAPEGFDIDEMLRRRWDEALHHLPAELAHLDGVLRDLQCFSFSISGVELDGLSELVLAGEGEMTPELMERLGRVQARVVLDFGSKQSSEQAMSLLETVANKAEGALRKPALDTEGVDADAALVVSAPGGSGFDVWAIQRGGRVLLGAGIAAFANYLAGGPSLADEASYEENTSHLLDARGTTVTRTYFRIDGLSEFGKTLSAMGEMPAPVVEAISFLLRTVAPGGQVEVSSQTRLIGERFVSETFRRDHGEGATIFDIAGNRPVTPGSFRMVPEEAVACWATTLDKSGMRAFLSASLEALSGGDPEAQLEALAERYDTRPDRDLIDSLGDEFVVYTMPFAGIGMPKAFVAIELVDPVAFARGVEGLGAILVDVTGGAVSFQAKPYRKLPFFSFAPGMDLTELAGGGAAGGFTRMTPAFVSMNAAIGVVEDRAVISLSDMYTKREMKRLLKHEGGTHPLAASGGVIPEGAVSYGTTDWGTIIAEVYDAVSGFIPLIQKGIEQSTGEPLPFSPQDLPPSDIFKEYFRPTITYGKNLDGGTYTYDESSVGPEVPLVLGATALSGAVFAAFTVGNTREMEVRATLEAPPEELFEEEGGRPRQQTIDALREIKVGIVLYKSDQGRYPLALARLVEPTAKYTAGFLGGPAVPKDGWENEINYHVSQDGTSFRIWSSGPDGVNQDGKGDDVLLSN